MQNDCLLFKVHFYIVLIEDRAEIHVLLLLLFFMFFYIKYTMHKKHNKY